MSHQEHKAHGPASVACFVLTVRDTRTPDTDTSGRAIRELLTAAGHSVARHAIMRDEPAQNSLEQRRRHAHRQRNPGTRIQSHTNDTEHAHAERDRAVTVS